MQQLVINKKKIKYVFGRFLKLKKILKKIERPGWTKVIYTGILVYQYKFRCGWTGLRGTKA